MPVSKDLTLITPLPTRRKDFISGQAAAWPKTPCHGDIFHIQHQGKELVSFLSRRAAGANSRRQKLEQEMQKAKLQGQGCTLSTQLILARRAELARRATCY